MSEFSTDSPDKGTVFSQIPILSCGSEQLDLSQAVVMGILNVTPDSFFDGGRYNSIAAILARVEEMLGEGASIIDVGAISTRPGSMALSETDEFERLIPVIRAITKAFPGAIISADTYRAAIARQAAEAGAHIINDVSGGTMDNNMLATMCTLDAAYVLMHIRGTPETMQQNPQYNNVVREVSDFFVRQLQIFTKAGKTNIIIDPGFGFGKTVAHNFELLHGLSVYRKLPYPLLAGLSRKSMINRVLGISPAEALNGTTVLNTIALLNGANILRVHDVKPAVEAIKLLEALHPSA